MASKTTPICGILKYICFCMLESSNLCHEFVEAFELFIIANHSEVNVVCCVRDILYDFKNKERQNIET